MPEYDPMDPRGWSEFDRILKLKNENDNLRREVHVLEARLSATLTSINQLERLLEHYKSKSER